MSSSASRPMQRSHDRSSRKDRASVSESMEPLIVTRDLTKVYRMEGYAITALKNVSMRIDGGEFVAVMGPSGSGKSTFMNLLGCLDTPSSGEYSLDGVQIDQLAGDQLAAVRN